MKQQLGVARQSMESFKAGNNNFIQQIWRNHYMCSESLFQIGSLGANSKMSSVWGVSRAVTLKPKRGSYSITRTIAKLYKYASNNTRI